MSVGVGWNRPCRRRVTSTTSWLCSKVRRLFITRTITASTRCFRSSSTVAGTSPTDALPAAPELHEGHAHAEKPGLEVLVDLEHVPFRGLLRSDAVLRPGSAGVLAPRRGSRSRGG